MTALAWNTYGLNSVVLLDDQVIVLETVLPVPAEVGVLVRDALGDRVEGSVSANAIDSTHHDRVLRMQFAPWPSGDRSGSGDERRRGSCSEHWQQSCEPEMSEWHQTVGNKQGLQERRWSASAASSIHTIPSVRARI